MADFTMPSLGADMDEGTLVEWRVAPGDHVTRGDIVAVVETDKASIDVEVFTTGVVQVLLVEPGTRVPVGTPLARIDTADAGTPARPPVPARTPEATGPTTPTAQLTPEPAGPEPAGPSVTTVAGGHGRHQASVLLSPLVRRLAEQQGVDVARVHGTGPGHRVTRVDVERAASTQRVRVSPRARRRAAEHGIDLATVAPGSSTGLVHERDVLAHAVAPGSGATPRTSARLAMARSMERSHREIPQYHLALTLDLEPALAWLDDQNTDRRPADRVIPAALLLRAVAVAARGAPELNGWWIDGDLRPADTVDLGVAVALRGGGLLTPTLARADRASATELMARLRDLVERARRGSLRSSDLATASITVTNLGDRGAELVHGIIHPPQVALVGFGRITTRPWAEDGEVSVHRTVTVTLAADHRASDGHVGSRFLAALERQLARPHDFDEVGDDDGTTDDGTREDDHGS